MALKLSIGTRNCLLGNLDDDSGARGSIASVPQNASGNSFQKLFHRGFIRIFSGTQPTEPDDVETGNLLCKIGTAGTLKGLIFGSAVGGCILKNATNTWQGTAIGAGTQTAGWFRFYDSAGGSLVGARGGTLRGFDGNISTSGAELNMSNLSITNGGVVTIDSFKVKLPIS